MTTISKKSVYLVRFNQKHRLFVVCLETMATYMEAMATHMAKPT
jgi:hypothetical protein